jgi:serine/threonine protein kinase
MCVSRPPHRLRFGKELALSFPAPRIGHMPDLQSRLNEALTGRYVLDREIGAGGMATVFLARDLRHERDVTLKVLDPELAASIRGRALPRRDPHYGPASAPAHPPALRFR